MNFHTRPQAIGDTTIPVVKPPMSSKAQEVIAIIEEVQAHPETEHHLEGGENGGRKWLSMCNINNGHNEASPEFKALMFRLSSALNGHLVDAGQHSNVYYELKKAGYSLRTGESDSFGPLSAVLTAPNNEWQVCYG